MTQDDLRRALVALAEGRIVAAATETYFGLLADARRTDSIDRVFALKGRSATKGVALLLPNRSAWLSLVGEVPELADRLAERFWPGPLTIALPARREVDARLTVDGTVAVRWAGPSDASQIAEAFGAPLTATSANMAGGAPCLTDADVAHVFAEALAGGGGDLLLVAGRAPGGAPSTLLRVAEGKVHLVRRGRITESDLAGIVPGGGLG